MEFAVVFFWREDAGGGESGDNVESDEALQQITDVAECSSEGEFPDPVYFSAFR